MKNQSSQLFGFFGICGFIALYTSILIFVIIRLCQTARQSRLKAVVDPTAAKVAE